MTPSRREIESRLSDLEAGPDGCQHPFVGELWRDSLLNADDSRRTMTDDELDAGWRALAECPNCQTPEGDS